MKNYNIDKVLIATLLFGACACSQEEPFINPEDGEGFLNRDAMAVEFKNAEHLVRSRADVNMGDFQVQIRRKAATGEGEIVKQYAYSEMPEIVALPVGDYTVNAVYGTNPHAEWDAPYYLGNSEFSIEANKITDDLDPVVCKLSNIRVTINFDQELSEALGENAKVTVRVGQTGSLEYTKETQGHSGYFAFTPGSQTITATFTGIIDGDEISETKAYDNASPGNHYKISFALHQAGGGLPGSITGSVVVDATVTTEDMTENIDPGQDYPEDDMRPVEDPDTPPVGPDDPNPPTDKGPEVTASEGIDLEAVNDITDGMTCELYITSKAEGGVTAFTVDIISDTLTADELEGVGLSSHLDMVNPGDLAEALEGLGFPINVGGMKEITFAITDFLPMLSALGPGNHEFRLTVKDADGTKTLSLKLKS